MPLRTNNLKRITDSGLGTEIAIAHVNMTYVNLERIICDTLKYIILQALALLHKESVTSKRLLQIFSLVLGISKHMKQVYRHFLIFAFIMEIDD